MLLLLACTPDNGFTKVTDYGGVYESSIAGRVCDPARSVWLEGASVYTHIIVDEELVGTAEAITDADGRYFLGELRGDTTYTLYVQHGSDVLDMFDVTVEGTEEVVLPDPVCSASASGAVAVVSGDYDAVADVLNRFGITDVSQVNGQTGDELAQLLQDPANLAGYQAIVFAGGHMEEDVFYDADGSGTDVSAVRAALEAFVVGGGTLWATDWSYDVIETIWPGKVQWMGDDGVPNAAQLGTPIGGSAHVPSDELAAALGTDTVAVEFDLDTWPVAESADADVILYQTMDAPWRYGMEEGTTADAPVAFEYPMGKGRVIYTSWTLDANAGAGEGVIRYLLDRI